MAQFSALRATEKRDPTRLDTFQTVSRRLILGNPALSCVVLRGLYATQDNLGQRASGVGILGNSIYSTSRSRKPYM
jgi:hypothetical protein